MRSAFSTLYLLLLVILLIIITGCAGTALTPATNAKKAEKRVYDNQPHRKQMVAQQSIDLYAFGDDDWTPSWQPVIPDTRPPSGMIAVTSSETVSSHSIESNNLLPVQPKMVQGFRIQLVNVMDEELANRVREEAMALFDSVYISFRRPNYKVRAGDFLNRLNADTAADSARAHGFTDAWVVPSKVYQFEKRPKRLSTNTP